MSKYQILTNTDCNNDGSTTTTTTTATLTDDDDDENYEIFYRDDNNDQLRLNNNHHQINIKRQQHNNHHHYNNHYFDDDDDFHHNDIHPHRESLSSNGNHVEDLIQYNNDDSTITNNTKQSVNSNTNTTGKVIIMNGNRNHNYNNKTSNIKTNTNNLMAELNAAEANDSTMEIPLLHHDHHHHHHQNNNSNGMNYNKQLDFEYVCLCQQKGFASNLNNNSTQTAKSKILWAIALCCIFMIVEFLGGYIAGSLAIMTDAAHLASDCISFVIGLVAIWLGSRPPDATMSFGYKRLEVMGAIVSILGIWILTTTLVLVAIQRIYSNDYDLDANTMMTISGIGILINIIMIFILHTSVLDLPAGSIGSSHGHSHNHSHHGHSHSHSSPSLHRRRHSNNDGNHLHSELSSRSLVTTDSDATADAAVVDSGEATSIELSSAPLVLNGNDFKHQQDGKEKNLNLRAAMIHVIGDLVQSFGVFIASILIKIYPKAVFLDPLCTLLFSVIVVMTTINLFKESMHLIMDSVPQGLSIDNLEMDLLNIEGVKSVHHLNVWNHTSNHSILMVHLIIDFLADSNTVLLKATQLAASVKYNIKHSTIQIERVTT